VALLLDCKQKDTSSFWGFVVFRRVTLAAQLRCLRTEGTALGHAASEVRVLPGCQTPTPFTAASQWLRCDGPNGASSWLAD